MSSFYHRLDEKIMEAGLSYRDLSLRIGKGETYVSTMIRNRNDPGLSTVVDICQVLDIRLEALLTEGSAEHCPVDGNPFESSLDDDADAPTVTSFNLNEIADDLIAALLDRAERQGNRPGPDMSLDELMSWWTAHGGRLENVDKFLEKIDLFAPPESCSDLPVPARLGSGSLVAKEFKLEDEDHLRKLLVDLDKGFCRSIADSHREALAGKPVLTVESINVEDPLSGEMVKVKYNRLLLPVHDFSRSRFVLNYSQPVNSGQSILDDVLPVVT